MVKGVESKGGGGGGGGGFPLLMDLKIKICLECSLILIILITQA